MCKVNCSETYKLCSNSRILILNNSVLVSNRREWSTQRILAVVTDVWTFEFSLALLSNTTDNADKWQSAGSKQ